MKKMMKAAAVLAAMVMALSLSACSNNDDDEPSDGDGVIATLPKASGRDPFKNGYYESTKGKWKFFSFIDKDEKDDNYSYAANYCKFDTSNRTMTLLYDSKNEKMDWNSAQFKYTYDEEKTTITMTLLKIAIPQDIDTIDSDEPMDFELATLTEVEKALNKYFSSNDDITRWMERYRKEFETLLTYRYETSEDNCIKLTLTSPTPIDDEQSTTLQFVGN